MLRVYRDTGSFLASKSTNLPGEIIWMDLVNPTDEEKSFVEARARVRIPSNVAGIYGMNFKFMPELAWEWGYPFGLTLIVLSALIPILWFKWKGWI
jgi:Mg2+ and Co2+ transporter CorA